ncbi:MAG: hypothetical protein HRU23_15225 [Gammaproteobacteria bacterium]|nr:hypothetical protein [Gammaproteobacteria bacterium]
MTSSISLNANQTMQWQHAQLSANNLGKSSIFSLESIEKTPSANAINQLRSSNRISNIDPTELKALYSQIKTHADAQLDAANIQNKDLQPFDYLQNNIDTIADYPIEVEIEPDEVNTAILYNSLGINFLDVKRIEMKMDLFELAKNDVKENEKAGLIRKDEADALNKQIQGHMDSLLDQKQALLDRKSVTDSEEALFKQLRLKQTV